MERGKGFQEQLQRTHGQRQRGWNQGKEVGMAGVRGNVGGKYRQLYLNNNKIIF